MEEESTSGQGKRESIESVKRSSRYKAGDSFVVVILFTKQFSDLNCFWQYNHCCFVNNDEDNGYFSF